MLYEKNPLKNPTTSMIRMKLCYIVLRIYDSGYAILKQSLKVTVVNIFQQSSVHVFILSENLLESTGRVDYAIKALKELICITVHGG